MAMKLVKVKHLKGGERVRAWYGYEFSISYFDVIGDEVILYDKGFEDVGRWNLEQYIEVLDEDPLF